MATNPDDPLTPAGGGFGASVSSTPVRQCETVTFILDEVGPYTLTTVPTIPGLFTQWDDSTQGPPTWLPNVPAGTDVTFNFVSTSTGDAAEPIEFTVRRGTDTSCLTTTDSTTSDTATSATDTPTDSTTSISASVTSTTSHKPTPTTKPSQDSSSGSSKKSNAGTIAGAVIGTLLGIGLVLLAVWFYRRKTRQGTAPQKQLNSPPPGNLESGWRDQAAPLARQAGPAPLPPSPPVSSSAQSPLPALPQQSGALAGMAALPASASRPSAGNAQEQGAQSGMSNAVPPPVIPRKPVPHGSSAPQSSQSLPGVVKAPSITSVATSASAPRRPPTAGSNNSSLPYLLMSSDSGSRFPSFATPGASSMKTPNSGFHSGSHSLIPIVGGDPFTDEGSTEGAGAAGVGTYGRMKKT